MPTDRPKIVRVMVGPNTFRAFHNMPRKPSLVFRGWALEALIGRPGYFEKLLSIQNRANYDRWLNHFAADLSKRLETPNGL